MTWTAPSVAWRSFPSPEALAESLADEVAKALMKGAGRRGKALLAVSGGTTPMAFLRALSARALAWERVTVTLVDERFVSTESVRSNEKTVRENLIQNEAAGAKFVSLYSETGSVEQAAQVASAGLAALPFPIDAAVLGMGLDGHTASFFPDADNLAALLDPHSPKIVMPVRAASAIEPRLTLSLARLVEAGFVALHIEGNAKRMLLASAMTAETAAALPVQAVLRHSTSPVEIFWAPNKDEIP